MATKNLGQVSGVFIGTTPPDNTILIWYDNTPNQKLHKVYDINLSQWVVLDKNTISTITYSELVNLATGVGLSVGAWFKISLALSITSTKVQYNDSLGNILIDDLGSNIQYHVTSSNLLVDDISGVFDSVNKKLVFQFNEQVPDYVADDYVLGKIVRSGVWSLAKYKLSSFLSSVTGNSITWNGGFFFNFNTAIRNIFDKSGGVVSKDSYDSDQQTLNTAINNVGEANQAIIENASQDLSTATTPTAIYNKAIPNDLTTGGVAIDAAKGDTLYTIISKFQRWINQFKLATGIRVSTEFTEATTQQYINSNDTVETALGKVQYWFKNISSYISGYYTKTEVDSTVASINSNLSDIDNRDNGLELLGVLTHRTGVGELDNLSYKYKNPNSTATPVITLSSGPSTAVPLSINLLMPVIKNGDNVQINWSDYYVSIDYLKSLSIGSVMTRVIIQPVPDGSQLDFYYLLNDVLQTSSFDWKSNLEFKLFIYKKNYDNFHSKIITYSI